jgi:hypothetical protein
MSNRKYLPKYITLISISILILISLIPLVFGETITDFKTPDSTVGEPDITYSIKSPDEDLALEATGYFEIPTHRGEIKRASLNIKCEGENDNYLTDPRLDIGLDGDYEWRYNGKGYGEAGHQIEFSSGIGKRRVVTAKRGADHYDNRTSILLPKTANIKSASLMIKGGPGQFKEDVLASIHYSGRIYYTKSNRDGTFGSVVNYYDVSTGSTYGIGLGDFDNDNDLDIVFGEGAWGWGNINFYVIENTNAIPHPWGSNPNNNKIFIGSIKTSGSNYYPYDVAVEDFDNDGYMDFVGSVRSGNLYFFKGWGDLSFNIKKLAVTYPGTYSLGKDAADLNNDGNMDIVVGGIATGNVYYYEGIGNGSFEPGIAVPAGGGNYQYGVVTADFNDDYDVDIITKGRAWGTGASTYMKFIEGNGDGTFMDPIDSNINLGSWWEYGPSDGFDFNYDGYQDMAVMRSGSLYYYEGLGTGDFKTDKYLGSVSGGYSVTSPPRMPLGGCVNLTMDIGDDRSIEKTFTGTFDGDMTQTITFKNELNTLMASSSNNLQIITDEYGNELYKIPLRFDSKTIGSIQLEELDIKYE